MPNLPCAISIQRTGQLDDERVSGVECRAALIARPAGESWRELRMSDEHVAAVQRTGTGEGDGQPSHGSKPDIGSIMYLSYGVLTLAGAGVQFLLGGKPVTPR